MQNFENPNSNLTPMMIDSHNMLNMISNLSNIVQQGNFRNQKTQNDLNETRTALQQQLNQIREERQFQYGSNRNPPYGSYPPQYPRSPRPHRDQSPNRDSNSGNRSRSRSPSPTPSNNKCFMCKEEHWMIECPHLTREEKELELYKILQRKQKQGNNDPMMEEQLRRKYGIAKVKKNKAHTHDHSIPVTGSGHYCKWCNVKGHSMWICPRYCSICEKEGHNWENCKSNPPFVNNRKLKLQSTLKRFKLYSSDQ